MISSIVVFNWSNYHILFDEHVKGRSKIQVRPQNMQRNYIYICSSIVTLFVLDCMNKVILKF